MNTPVKKHIALFALIALGIVGSVKAQRGSRNQGGHRSFDRSNHSGGFSQAPSANRSSNGSFTNQSRHEAFNNNRPATVSVPNRQFQNGNNNAVASSRQPQRFDNNNAVFSQRSLDRRPVTARVNSTQTTRNVTVVNNNRVVNNYRYPSYNYAPRRYVYAGAPRYSALPHGYLSIWFGGYSYYYNSGLFYSHYGGYYQPVFAPIGIHINILPTGYHPFSIGPRRYYYYDGIYYSNYNNSDNEYEVVDAPTGATVSTLPKGATTATLNGEKFYEFNGTYYKEATNSKNEVVYTVVGKYGQVNNTGAGVPDLQKPALQVGDIIPVLPDNCKEVTINGEQLYVSPDNTYFKAQTFDGTTSYKIVGTGTSKQ